MKKHTENRVGMFIILAAIVVLIFAYSCRDSHGQTSPTPSPTVTATPSASPTPTAEPTPADGEDVEVFLDFIYRQADFEKFTKENYDPVTTRVGEVIATMIIVYQSESTDIAVEGTLGYENDFYDDGTGDIRGLRCQGFVDIEATGVAFKLLDILIPNAYADSDKWKKVKKLKVTKAQTKPSTPKKTKWKKEYGLKEKKEKFDK